MLLKQESIDVLLGLDIGETGHHAVASKRAWKKLYDRALPRTKPNRDVLAMLRDGTLFEDPTPKNLPSAAWPKPYRHPQHQRRPRTYDLLNAIPINPLQN